MTANKLTGDRRKWQTQVDESKKKLASADGTAREKLSALIAELSEKISNADAELKRLKSTSFKWRYSKKGLRSILLCFRRRR
ncbi:MAG: hypothetical protein ACYTGS_18955 [Planctomycetota bacterium]